MKTYLAQFAELPTAVRGRVLKQSLTILGVSALLAAFAAWQTQLANSEAGRLKFDNLSDKIVLSVDELMEGYEHVLRGGAALFGVMKDVSRKQWADYVAALKLEKTYPGIMGLGFVAVVEPSNIEAITASAQSDGLSDFAIHPPGERDLITTILYLEPMNWRNRRALGYDMYSEPVRRVAMQRAIETGKPSVSKGVTLLQETNENVQRGVLIYLPIFREATEVNKGEGRSRKLLGFIYTPIRMSDFLNSVLPRIEDNRGDWVRVQLFDGENASPDTLLFDSTKNRSASDFDPNGTYQQQRTIDVHGTNWGVRIASRPEFERDAHTHQPWLIGAGVFLLGSLASLLFGIVSLGKESAHQVADRLASEIEVRKRAQEETRVALRELGHRVKNTLTIVTAVASQSVRHSQSLADFDSKFRTRLLGLSRVHDLLTSGRTFSTDFLALAEEVLRPYRGDNEGALVLDGPRAQLAPNSAIMLSMLLNELATNATKYGAWANGKGGVTMSWDISKREDGEEILHINWRENGGPQVVQPTRRGFGSNVIKFSIERSLRGIANVNYPSEGVIYDIQIPWSEVQAREPHQ